MISTDPTTWPDSPTPAEILAAREAAGLTQREAGALVYAAATTWAAWERGRRPMHSAIWELWQIKAQALRRAA